MYRPVSCFLPPRYENFRMGRSAFILTIKVVEETRSRLELSSKQCFGSCGDTHTKSARYQAAKELKSFLNPLAPSSAPDEQRRRACNRQKLHFSSSSQNSSYDPSTINQKKNKEVRIMGRESSTRTDIQRLDRHHSYLEGAGWSFYFCSTIDALHHDHDLQKKGLHSD